MWILAVAASADAAAPALDVGYYGDLVTHPGALARGSVALASARSVTWALEGQALTYWHPGLFTLAAGRMGPALRLVGPRDATWGLFLHGGVAHGFWAAPTFEVVDGGVRRTPLSGDTWAVVASGVELGHAISRGPLRAWAVRPQVGLRAPTFHGVGIDLAVEATARLGGHP